MLCTTAAATDWYLLPAGPTAANLQQRVVCCGPTLGQMDGQTDRRTLYCCCSLHSITVPSLWGWLIDWLSKGFTSHPTQNMSFWRCFLLCDFISYYWFGTWRVKDILPICHQLVPFAFEDPAWSRLENEGHLNNNHVQCHYVSSWWSGLTNVIGTAHVVYGAGSVKQYSVCLSVCPSLCPQQRTHCCRFAAVGPAGRRYQSIAAAAAGKCRQCHIISICRYCNWTHRLIYLL